MVMDRFRHHGSPRRILPKVTVEEVDESELPAAPASNAESAPESAPEGPADDAAGTRPPEPANEREPVSDEARAPRSAP